MGLRVAYLTGRYPAVSHTFITQEIRALRSLGVDVRTFSIWPTAEGELLSEVDRAEAAATVTLLPPRPLRLARAHAGALARHPLRYARTLGRALWLSRPGVRGRLLGLSWFVEAMLLWRECRAIGIRHVHAQLNGTAPSVALLVTAYADGTDGGRPWTFSMTVHGSAEFYDAPNERLGDKVRAAAFVACVSDFTRAQLMGMVEEPHWAKLRVVHCGVYPDEFAPVERAPRDGRALRILTVGRLTQAKGYAVLVEALAQLVGRGIDARLTIVGEGPLRGELERVARQRGVDDRLDLPGAIGHDRVRAHYESADVFCLTSFAEGVPVVLMEAMATELPVVATAIMGVPELVEDGVNGLLVPPARADRTAAALELVARAPEQARARAARGRERVLADFDIRASATQLRDQFAALLGEQRPAGDAVLPDPVLVEG